MFSNTRFFPARVGLLVFGLVFGPLLGCAGMTGGAASEMPGGKLRRSTQVQLDNVDAKIAVQKWDEALAALDGVAQGDLNPYERALLSVKRANVYSATKQYEQATGALKQAVELKAMPQAEQLQTSYRLLNLYLGLQHHDAAVALIESEGLPDKNPDPEQAFMLAQAYAGAKRDEVALPYAQAAVAGSGAPAEDRLQLLCDLQQRLGHNAEAAAVAEQLVKSFPTQKANYLRLAAIDEQLGRSDGALRALELAHEQGLLTQELELLALVDLALKQGQGAKGAAWLEQHMRDGKITKSPENQLRLVLCWLAAKDPDRAQAALGGLDEDTVPGDVLLDLAKLYVRRGEWLKAREPLGLCLGRNVTSPGVAYLLLGIVHYNTGDKPSALQALGKAERQKDTVACAQQWLSIVGKGRPSKDATCPAELTEATAR
jgi:tetratricopeptide (TPR) repeat protein